MRLAPRSRVLSLTALTGVALAGGLIAAPAATAQASCSDVEVIFARGTGELSGLGTVGRPFVRAVTDELSGYSVSSYAVDYAANVSQTSSGPGSTDMVERIESVAAECPGTRFVIGGYSQGATVTTKAVGVRSVLGSGTVIPDELSERIAAVVVFGNPLGKRGGSIADDSDVYGSRAMDICASRDAVCDPSGASWLAHASYGTGGLVDDGAEFAADLVRNGSAPGGDPAPGDDPAPDPGATPSPEPGSGGDSGSFWDRISEWRSGSDWGSGWSDWGSGWSSWGDWGSGWSDWRGWSSSR